MIRVSRKKKIKAAPLPWAARYPSYYYICMLVFLYRIILYYRTTTAITNCEFFRNFVGVPRGPAGFVTATGWIAFSWRIHPLFLVFDKMRLFISFAFRPSHPPSRCDDWKTRAAPLSRCTPLRRPSLSQHPFNTPASPCRRYRRVYNILTVSP